MRASSFMTAKVAANGSGQSRVIVAYSAHTDQCRVRLCKPVIAANSGLGTLRNLVELNVCYWPIADMG
jgi:hypothetical protein